MAWMNQIHKVNIEFVEDSTWIIGKIPYVMKIIAN